MYKDTNKIYRYDNPIQIPAIRDAKYEKWMNDIEAEYTQANCVGFAGTWPSGLVEVLFVAGGNHKNIRHLKVCRGWKNHFSNSTGNVLPFRRPSPAPGPAQQATQPVRSTLEELVAENKRHAEAIAKIFKRCPGHKLIWDEGHKLTWPEVPPVREVLSDAEYCWSGDEPL